jgi:nicotinate-nucleotide pyrophosphorylase (carboxylating)
MIDTNTQQTIDTTQLVAWALQEDAPQGDITSEAFVLPDTIGEASITAKASGIFFGKPIIDTFQTLIPSIHFIRHCEDGESVVPGQVVLSMKGPFNELLRIERVLLNLLQRFCGIASMTRKYINALSDSKIQIMETRKTTPLWRRWEKEAVRAGGGSNHRNDLSDMVLIKENHLAHIQQTHRMAAFAQLLKDCRQKFPDKKIELEVETLEQVETFPLDLVDIVMLDNFSIFDIGKAAHILRGRGLHIPIEASGNVTLNTIEQYRGLPIQRISVGAITHSVVALDLSMRFQ